VPDDGYEYLVGLKDEMSAQSKAITSALDAMSSALGRSDHAVKSHGEAHREAAHDVKEHEGAMQGFLSALARSATGGGIGGGLTSAFATGTLVAHAVEKVGELVGEGARFAVEASEFKENAIGAYTVIRGTAEEGERTFAELDKTAREIHMPAERAHEIAQRLMLEGLESQKAVTDTVRAVGDLQRVGLEAGASKLQAIVERSISAGHFDVGKGARGLKGTGVTFDALAAELGMGRKQFEAELHAGKISAETGIEAIDSVILKGKVGALATKKFTISDALTDMKNSIRGVFQETDSGPVVDAFKRMSESFTESGESAKDTKEAVNALLELGAGLIDLSTGIGTTLVGAVNALKSALGFARQAASGLLDMLRDVSQSAASFFQSPADKRFSAAAEAEIDKRVDKELRTKIEAAKLKEITEFGKASHTTSEVHALGKKLNVDLFDAAKEEIGGSKGQPSVLKPTGPIEVRTLSPKESFEASGRGMRETGKDAGAALHEGAKEGLDAHSPSRKMFDLGLDAADGFKAGAASANELHSRDAAAGPTSIGGKSVHVEVQVGGINLHGLMHGDDFLPLLESQVADVFERVALELGA
jgi:hypothetical protein